MEILNIDELIIIYKWVITCQNFGKLLLEGVNQKLKLSLQDLIMLEKLLYSIN